LPAPTSAGTMLSAGASGGRIRMSTTWSGSTATCRPATSARSAPTQTMSRSSSLDGRSATRSAACSVPYPPPAGVAPASSSGCRGVFIGASPLREEGGAGGGVGADPAGAP
jgi:hypothetical protein